MEKGEGNRNGGKEGEGTMGGRESGTLGKVGKGGREGWEGKDGREPFSKGGAEALPLPVNTAKKSNANPARCEASLQRTQECFY